MQVVVEQSLQGETGRQHSGIRVANEHALMC